MSITNMHRLMAIMLGRLEMDIDECISAYTALSDRIFQKQRHRVKINGKIQGRFNTAELERSIKEIIVQKGLQEDTLLKISDNARCKVYKSSLITKAKQCRAQTNEGL